MMRYVRQEDIEKYRVNLEACGNISVTGSVTGMQRIYGWQKNGQIRVGSYIYNIGPREVERLRAIGIIRGE